MPSTWLKVMLEEVARKRAAAAEARAEEERRGSAGAGAVDATRSARGASRVRKPASSPPPRRRGKRG